MLSKDVDKMSERELRAEVRELRDLVRSIDEALEVHEGVSIMYYLTRTPVGDRVLRIAERFDGTGVELG